MQRRTVLSSIAAAGSMLAAPAIIGRAAAATAPFDASNPAHVALAYRKLGWSATEKLSMHWINLTRYGMVDTKLTTLWESVIGILFFTTDVKDAPGDYNVTSCSFEFLPRARHGRAHGQVQEPLHRRSARHSLRRGQTQHAPAKSDGHGHQHESAAGHEGGGVFDAQSLGRRR
ncbi:MAG: hypothetical protein JNK21_11385 [Rhodospirillaceae bacterium]|nr:hypothetical protein [Rhodospirillaceae bacterium]